jgi:archaellum component FlaC
MAMNVEAEIRELKRRVGELEGSFGFLTQQIKGVHKDLLAFQERTEQRFDHIDARFDGIDDRFGRVDGRLDQVGGRLSKVEGGLTDLKGHLGDVESGLKSLREDLPEIVGDAVRAVMRQGNGKPRKTK